MTSRRFVRCSLVSLLALAGCASVDLQNSWASYSWLGAEPSSEAKVFGIECGADATTVRLSLTTHGGEGELALLLVDPAGIERHRETLQGGRREATLRWPASRGVWTLQVTPKDFTGSYNIELCDQDQPPAVQVNVAGDVPR